MKDRTEVSLSHQKSIPRYCNLVNLYEIKKKKNEKEKKDESKAMEKKKKEKELIIEIRIYQESLHPK